MPPPPPALTNGYVWTHNLFDGTRAGCQSLIVSSHVFFNRVAVDLLAAAPGWLPSYFSGASAAALRAGLSGQTIVEAGGEVLEGWRVSEMPTALDYDPRAVFTPVYRQGNIKPFRLQLGAQHWTSPHIEGRW